MSKHVIIRIDRAIAEKLREGLSASHYQTIAGSVLAAAIDVSLKSKSSSVTIDQNNSPEFFGDSPD